MRLKKWRSPTSNRITIFVNDFLPDTNVAVVSDGADGWVVSKGPGDRIPLTAEQIQEVKEGVEEITGVAPEDGFKALCKEVEW